MFNLVPTLLIKTRSPTLNNGFNRLILHSISLVTVGFIISQTKIMLPVVPYFNSILKSTCNFNNLIISITKLVQTL